MTASAPGAAFSDMQSVPNSGAAGYAREARIRSQTTFAGFVRRADGDYDLKVIKQKIQVDCAFGLFPIVPVLTSIR